MAKKRKIVFKGVRYISKTLSKYYPKRYPNQKAALSYAHEVYNQIQKSGQKVRVKSIFDVVRKKRAPSEPKGREKTSGAPELNPKLFDLLPFFGLVDYPRYLFESDLGVVFTSDIFPSTTKQINSGEPVSYFEVFSPFVNYINEIQDSGDRADRKYETEWLITCTRPKPVKGVWHSKIICTDSGGGVSNYGFDPKNPKYKEKVAEKPSGAPSGPAKEKQKPKGPELPPEPEKGPLVSDGEIKKIEAETKRLSAEKELKQAEANLKKQSNIAEAFSLFREGLINKKDLTDLIKTLNG